jgi:phospholipid/cholesterol/gamma-HCH transport system ATP-binding protein
VLGRDLTEVGDEERVAVLRRVGMLFQGGALLGSMTVGDNVGLPLREHTRLPPAIIRRVVDMKLEQVGLGGKAGLMPAELSGGMRKRASLSRAMALDPDLLLCDEPSAGLDPIVAAGIDEVLLAMRRTFGISMLVVSHDIASVRRIADRALLMKDGVIVARGAPAELAESREPIVRDFFDRRPPPAVAAASGTLLDALGLGEAGPAEQG